MLADGDSQLAPISELCPDSFNGVFDAECDNWSVQQAADLLPSLGQRGRRAPVVVRLHYETLAAPHLREAFMILCRRLPRTARRYLLFEVLNIPLGLPQGGVRELLAPLRPFCLGLIARLPFDAIFAEHLVLSGVIGLSLDAEEAEATELTRHETLHMLVEAARAHRMRSLLVNAGSVRLCQHAHKAGFDQLSGPGFMPPVRQAGRAFSLQRGT
jgi:hypothetical protein